MEKHKVGDKVELNFPGIYYYFIEKNGKTIVDMIPIAEETLDKNIKRIESLGGFDGWILNPSTGIVDNSLELAINEDGIKKEIEMMGRRSVGELLFGLPYKRIKKGGNK